MTDENTSEGTTEEYVAIPDASDTDLEAFLDQSEAEEEAVESLPEEETITEAAEEESVSEKKLETVSKEEHDRILAELQKTKKQNETQSAFINRQANELGDTRKQLVAALDKNVDLFQNGDLDELQRARLGNLIVKNEADIQEVDEQAQMLSRASDNMAAVKRFFGDVEFPTQEVAMLMREDGIDLEGVQQFLNNPLGSMTTTAVINLGKRAMERREREVLKADTIKMALFAKQLLEENKNLKAKPNELLKSISSATNASVSLNGKNGGTGQARKPNASTLSELSDSDLDRILQSEV